MNISRTGKSELCWAGLYFRKSQAGADATEFLLPQENFHFAFKAFQLVGNNNWLEIIIGSAGWLTHITEGTYSQLIVDVNHIYKISSQQHVD